MRSIVVDASKIPGAFDRKIVILDNDKSIEEMKKARQEAKHKGIEMIENTPCLEFLLLNILGANTQNNSAFCKSEFEKNYIIKQRRGDVGRYKELFPKEKLEKKRGSNNVLDKLIIIIEGK